MRLNLHAPFLLIFLAFALAAPAAAKSSNALVDAPAQSPQTDGITTGTIRLSGEEQKKKRFEDFMAIWEPATHMTKSQWRRTCHYQLDEIPNL